MRPTKEQMDNAYHRLLAGESDAPAAFIELMLDPLIAVLQAKFPNLREPDLITDVVVDALLKFVQSPRSYQPERGPLWSYLYMDALGDLRNALDRVQRREAREVPFDPVAHDRPDRNNDIEEEAMQRSEAIAGPEGVDMRELFSRLREERFDPREWQIVLLMIDGERHTSVFARILGIEHLPVEIQRKQVKQCKDRLRKRLKRYGVKFYEH